MNRQRHMHDALASHRRRLVSSAAVAVLLAGWVAPVYADATIDTALEGLAPMTPGDLSDERGGFSFGNMNISFGFSISTTIAGGTLGPGVTVTTNFTINTPGDLQNLGTTITNNVQNQLKEKGLIDDGNPATPTLQQTIEDNVAASVAHLKEDAAPAATSTVVASAPASIPESASGLAPVAQVTPIVEVTMVAADIPPLEPVADLPPPSLPTPPEPTAGAPPAPDLPPPPEPVASAPPPPDLPQTPATKPESDPAPATNSHSAVAASVDPATGNIKLAFGSGGNVLLEYLQGQVSKIQNTENNVQITSEFKADYVIDGYNQVATAVNLSEQVRELTDQLMALGGH